MPKTLMLGLLAALFSALPGFAQQTPATTQQAPTITETGSSEPGKATRTQVVKASAVVMAIDKTSRTITLQGANGRKFEVVASDEVKNFDQINVNDRVLVKYTQAISLTLKKGGGVRELKEQDATTRAKPGEKPAGAVGHRMTIIADVTAVDPKHKTITVKGPQGNIVDLRVDNPDQFKVVKKGDQIEVEYVESLAMSVEPASSKGAKK